MGSTEEQSCFMWNRLATLWKQALSIELFFRWTPPMTSMSLFRSRRSHGLDLNGGCLPWMDMWLRADTILCKGRGCDPPEICYFEEFVNVALLLGWTGTSTSFWRISFDSTLLIDKSVALLFLRRFQHHELSRWYVLECVHPSQIKRLTMSSLPYPFHLESRFVYSRSPQNILLELERVNIYESPPNLAISLTCCY